MGESCPLQIYYDHDIDFCRHYFQGRFFSLVNFGCSLRGVGIFGVARIEWSSNWFALYVNPNILDGMNETS